MEVVGRQIMATRDQKICLYDIPHAALALIPAIRARGHQANPYPFHHWSLMGHSLPAMTLAGITIRIAHVNVVFFYFFILSVYI